MLQVTACQDLRSRSFNVDSQAGAIIVIHKCWRPVISAWMPKSSVQGRQSVRLGSSQIRHIHNHQVTVHGLDTGIHAGMTAVWAWQDLCKTARAGAWEPAKKGGLGTTPTRQLLFPFNQGTIAFSRQAGIQGMGTKPHLMRTA